MSVELKEILIDFTGVLHTFLEKQDWDVPIERKNIVLSSRVLSEVRDNLKNIKC